MWIIVIIATALVFTRLIPGRRPVRKQSVTPRAEFNDNDSNLSSHHDTA